MQVLSFLWGLAVLSVFLMMAGLVFGWWAPVVAVFLFVVSIVVSVRKPEQ